MLKICLEMGSLQTSTFLTQQKHVVIYIHKLLEKTPELDFFFPLCGRYTVQLYSECWHINSSVMTGMTRQNAFWLIFSMYHICKPATGFVGVEICTRSRQKCALECTTGIGPSKLCWNLQSNRCQRRATTLKIWCRREKVAFLENQKQ